MKMLFNIRLMCIAPTLAILFCVFVVLPAFLTNNDPRADNASKRLERLETILSALERLIERLFLVGDKINLDGVFLVRLVEDQLTAFWDHVIQPYVIRAPTEHPFIDLFERLDKFRQRAKEFRLEFIPKAQRNLPEYYKSMSFFLVGSRWDLWFPQQDLDRSSMPNYTYKSLIIDQTVGPLSDACMMEPYQKQCQYTDVCWNRMANKLLNGFSLTHQVLFILNGISVGCDKETENSALKWNKIGTKELLALECATILYEAEIIANRSFPSYHLDLFMEQIGLCGLAGYHDFFREDWLKSILSWQGENGCYYLDYNASSAEFNKDFPERKPNRKRSSLDVQGEEYNGSTAERSTYRQKRNEQLLTDDCLAHLTGVAAIALGQYIRFTLEPLLTE